MIPERPLSARECSDSHFSLVLKVPFWVWSVIKLYKLACIAARDALQISPAGYAIPMTIVATKKQCNNKGNEKQECMQANMDVSTAQLKSKNTLCKLFLCQGLVASGPQNLSLGLAHHIWSLWLKLCSQNWRFSNEWWKTSGWSVGGIAHRGS